MAEQNFSGALETWKYISLSELQKTLDAQGVELVDQQKESVVGRKALADKTKEFKKLPDSEKTNAFKGLLKAYQTEIDSLTKRCKSSENAFLNVYKLLAEAPDPYPLLEAAVDQTVRIAEAREQELELQRLREENAELKKRVADSSPLESAKKKAEARAEQLEQKASNVANYCGNVPTTLNYDKLWQMEEMIQEKIVQKENELNATYDERLRNYQEREQDLQRQVALAKNQLRDLRTSHESNQAKLIDQTQRQDQEVVAKLTEMDMVAADLERANSRVATVERRNEILRAEIESIRSGNDTNNHTRALETQVAQLEVELERLSRAMETQKSQQADADLASSKKLEEATKEIQRKSSEIEQLKLRLKQYADYDEIKRELEIMKFVEFGGFDDIDEENDQESPQPNGHARSNSHSAVQLPNPNADKANAEQGNSLEALLAAKNKRILGELTRLRILYTELEESYNTSEQRLMEASSELISQKALNERLENDLLSMNQHGGKPADSPPTDGADVLAELGLGTKKTSQPPAQSTSIPFTSSADTSILPIVTSQRDRFRQRNAELEEELRKQFQVISELRSEIKNLQADNLKLYEKVRYMQSYREEAGSRPPTSQLDPLPAPAGSGTGLDDMGKYRARYEEAMNPFEAFRGREATRAYQNLNPIERGVLVLTRAILGNRRARTFFICYAIALHLLVMFTTYECTTSSGTHLQKQVSPYGS
ncbi:hypothetical protein PC9H_007448 [Pleurotus ostreatus]|uniref:Protein CASP n=1 Tax=Pleurotus ostreatus TaxID=5322 RepID=A0A8H6ZR46_PLEOS|nr:uncharacterized protein PC9H_007448 [Pleurotus ostreatus]KAF7428227.1 hypothetical protein PC9H_007448 [Pleurotus ostreatus]